MNREAKRVAVTKGINLGPRIRLVHERIVGRDSTVIVDANNFAAKRIGILWIVAACRHEQGSVLAERYARSAIYGWIAAPDIFKSFERRTRPARSANSYTALFVWQRFGVRKIDIFVIRKVGMQRDVDVTMLGGWHTAFTEENRRWAAGYFLRFAIPHEMQFAGP